MTPSRFECLRCGTVYPASLMKDQVCTECRSVAAGHTAGAAHFEALEAQRALLAPYEGTEPVVVTRPALDVALSARRERAKRELCRRHLMPFVQRFNPEYKAGWVHKDICLRLEAFAQQIKEGKSPRLMLFMPPRHGKSELASRMFPAWLLGHEPTYEVIACSYAASLAMKFSRKVRSVVASRQYESIFAKTRVDRDNKAAENWLTSKGGGYMAAGVSGPLTGNGMNCGIIDDPVKNRLEAESEVVRSSIKEWYTSTFYTRLAPGAGILIILTRWHDDDLAGWLLEREKQGGDKWEVVRYPAEAEEDERFRNKGEALHPERYSGEALATIRAAIGPRDWASLYQQNPVALEGDYFQTSFIHYYQPDTRPPLDELVCYQAWDLAIGQREQNDFSVGVTIGVDARDKIWVLDVQRGRWAGNDLVEQILDVYERWTPQLVGIEKGHISMALGPFLNKRIRERRCYGFAYEELKTGRRDKIARSQSIRGRMQQGMVVFPAEAPWTMTLVNELLRFPNGKHDDQVDALAWVGVLLDRFAQHRAAPPIKKKSWKDKVFHFAKGGKSPMTS